MCSCISEMNNMLREHNTCLVTTMFRQPEVVAVRTDKINSKARKGAATVIASFCPFCGEKYAKPEAQANG